MNKFGVQRHGSENTDFPNHLRGGSAFPKPWTPSLFKMALQMVRWICLTAITITLLVTGERYREDREKEQARRTIEDLLRIEPESPPYRPSELESRDRL